MQKKKDFTGQYLTQIHEHEYEPTHLDTKNYFNFYEWKEACVNMLYLKFRMKKNMKQKCSHFILYVSIL